MTNDYRPMRRDPAEAMRELRLKWLKTPPGESGIVPGVDSPRVTIALMDAPLATGTMTVVAFHNGDASLYTTGSFGVIGGIKHEAVRAAAIRFITLREQFIDEAILSTDFSYPPDRRVRFYFVGHDGVHVIEGDEGDLTNPKNKYHGLFVAGDDVLTQLRLTTNIK